MGSDSTIIVVRGKEDKCMKGKKYEWIMFL